MWPRSLTDRRPAALPSTSRLRVPGLAYGMTDTEVSEPRPLLPETIQLLKRLENLSSPDDLDRIGAPFPNRAAGYHACPEPNLPNLRFHITQADAGVLAFAGKSSPGFEVLEVFRAGFQYHWRRDLVRTFEEQLPLVGRLYGLSDVQELVVEHLLLPLVRKGRVREVRGWLLFSQDLTPDSAAASLGEITMFRRSERSWPVWLPAVLSSHKSDAAETRGVLDRFRERWGPAKERRNAGQQ